MLAQYMAVDDNILKSMKLVIFVMLMRCGMLFISFLLKNQLLIQ